MTTTTLLPMGKDTQIFRHHGITEDKSQLLRYIINVVTRKHFGMMII